MCRVQHVDLALHNIGCTKLLTYKLNIVIFYYIDSVTDCPVGQDRAVLDFSTNSVGKRVSAARVIKLSR